MLKELNIYDATIVDETEGILAISLVDQPAIGKNFLYFSKDKPQVEVNLSVNEDKHIITGPILIPEKLIYRRDESTNNEYYIKFSKEVIQQLCSKMLVDGTFCNNTLMHLPGYISGLTPLEVYLAKSDSEWPEGSLIVSYKVTSEKLWKEIKDGTFRGFSIESLLDLVQPQKDLDEVASLVKQIKDKLRITGGEH